MNVTIRIGQKSDLAAALQLIKELAQYEKAPQEVEVSLNEMEACGFGESPLFKFLVAEQNNKITGLALYYYKYSTWKGKCIFLEDIIVTESERRQGIGSKLFKEVIRIAKAEKVKRLEWQVLEWNQLAIDFYKKFNSDFDMEWINCKLTNQQLQSL
jgi:GNAT superfamily N-acetyltransferase